MTEKDLKKLNRYQLLEMLIIQTERADELEAQLKAAEKQLEERELTMSSLGSIAEASLQLGDVFKAAQKAADIYLAEAKKRAVVAVNTAMVYTYYEIGRMIVEDEQKGITYASYGKETLKNISKHLVSKFGKGYSVDNLERMRKFYLISLLTYRLRP